MSDQIKQLEAQLLWKQGLIQQQQGQMSEAIQLYQRSIDLHPTAEAHTYMGWALSQDEGRIDDAIEACHKAIQVDPEFGNPYNDIGCYLMQKGDYEQAIPWLEQAKQAQRYEPRQFPYINLGRLYMRRGKWREARQEFEMAVGVAPADVGARKALRGLIARFN